jgi:hypothetical protein
MDAGAGVAAALAAAAEAFGAEPVTAPTPRWGALYARLGRDARPGASASGDFSAAIELIYEGYLLHYREPRAVVMAHADLAGRLLAGDFFYARGLRSIAALGDIDSVGLLARLMATCSYLRAVDAPFDADDALWAYTMGGLAAQHAGVPAEACAALFDEIDAGLDEPLADVRAAAARAAHTLDLADPGPLLAELEGGGAAPAAPATPAAMPPDSQR